jgi:hypothetical protein
MNTDTDRLRAENARLTTENERLRGEIEAARNHVSNIRTSLLTLARDLAFRLADLDRGIEGTRAAERDGYGRSGTATLREVAADAG